MNTFYFKTWLEYATDKLFESLYSKEAMFLSSIQDRGDAKKEASLLLTNALGLDPIYLFTYDHIIITKKQEDLLQEFLDRRIKGEPFAFIMGEKEFYGINFIVNEYTLIPRPETEFLVDEALSFANKDSSAYVIDLGCGSGCIGLSILSHRPCWNVLFVDIHPETLAVTQKNADVLGVTQQCQFMLADFTNATFSEKISNAQIVVSNPPYIPRHEYEQLHHEVKSFEPENALISENQENDDGLFHIRHVINIAEECLCSNGMLIMEHGYNQAKLCKELCSSIRWNNIQTKQDYAKIERYLVAYRSDSE